MLLNPNATVNEKRKNKVGELKDERHVLFVDDEEDLLVASEALLKRLGFKVTGVTSGADALAALSRAPDAFDVLVTDLFMPGMDGQALIEQVRIIRADMPVVLLSGMGDAIDQDVLDALAPVRVMGKPVRRDDLANAIRQVMEKSC
jgi:CheY-like chemotaxis protein